MLRDAHNKITRAFRISLTDRCNFRCFYCLPNGEPPLARKETILTFEEIAYIAGIFVSLVIEKIRLTADEPIFLKDVPRLSVQLSKLKPALKDMVLATTGFAFPD